MTIRPLSTKILVHPNVAPNVTPGGIIIPEMARDRRSLKGEILAVGPDVLQAVQDGDMVVYGKYSGTEVKLNGRSCMLMEEMELLAVIEGDDAGTDDTNT